MMAIRDSQKLKIISNVRKIAMRHLLLSVVTAAALLSYTLVPAEGLERATRAFLSVIDQANGMTLAELRAPVLNETP